jgi:hypothetical protein
MLGLLISACADDTSTFHRASRSTRGGLPWWPTAPRPLRTAWARASRGLVKPGGLPPPLDLAVLAFGACYALEHKFERVRCELGPRCSFCGTSTGPFREVEGLFTALMCDRCYDARHGPAAELLAHHDPGEPG